MNLKHHILKWSGILPLRRRMQNDQLVVLTAHRVSDGGDNPQWQPLRSSLDPNVFFAQIDELSKHYNWVDLDQTAAILAGDDLGIKNPALLTFDDGYDSNMRVLPGLHKRQIKPVFFMTTAYHNCSKTFWFDRFDYAIQQLTENHQISVEEEDFHFQAGQRLQLDAEYARLRKLLKASGWTDASFLHFFEEESAKIEQSTGRSLQAIQQGDRWSATMTDEQVTEVAQSGMATIGSHTVDHSRLIHLTPEQCVYQLEESKRELERLTGMECTSFCYPNGDHDAPSAQMVQDAGYKLAFTTKIGLVHTNDNPLTLNRIHLPSSANPVRLQAKTCHFHGLRQEIFGG